MLALPFDLPCFSRGWAALSSASREVGERVAAAASAALARELRCPVRIAGRPLPGTATEAIGWSRVAIDLSGVPAAAILEVESALVARIVDRLAGGNGELPASLSLTPIEAAALELFALVVLEGACDVPEVDGKLAPRIARGGDEPQNALLVALDVEVGGIRGRARLSLPATAVRAFRPEPRLGEAAGSSVLVASLRRGTASLSEDELVSLEPGDVLLLDGDAEPREQLRFPGGARAIGRCANGSFHVEDIAMTETAARLPITLEVELARVPMTLADIARLEPGAVLGLPCSPRGTVTLRAGDRAVAQGELVEVEGSIGVRIVRLGE